MSIKIDGEQYYTVKEFASLTNRTEQSVRRLITEGNRIRCLKSIKVGHTILIPQNELLLFPFTMGGHGGGIYHYIIDSEGQSKVTSKTPEAIA